MSLNPDYLLRMAKEIQRERLQEAEAFRRWNGHRTGLKRLQVDTASPRPRPVDEEGAVELCQKAS